MSAALLLITHENIAKNLLAIAGSIINGEPKNISYIEVPMDASVEDIELWVDRELAQLDTAEGLFVITDIYGGTPSNIAEKIAARENTCLISGLNLPMLVRIMNYRTLPLAELLEKAVNGGQKGITMHGNQT